MSHSNFTVAYDGPAVADHTMDVRDLAPAMLALGELCDAANLVLNGSTSKIKVNVKATAPGSFEIIFEIVQNLSQQFLSLLTSQDASAAANLKTLIFGGGPVVGVQSLFWLIKKLKGKTPTKTSALPNDIIRITIEDQSVDVPLALLRLYQDLSVRAATQKVVEQPLKAEGLTSFEIREQGAVTLTVDKEESVYFSKPSIADSVLVDTEQTSAFSIISLAFKEDNKWRLNDGTNSISASIEDQGFLSRVDNNQISFSKGDILICRVRFVQKQTEGGLKTEYTIIRVIEHRPAARQIPLPFEDDHKTEATNQPNSPPPIPEPPEPPEKT